jgi:hypothetical protein
MLPPHIRISLAPHSHSLTGEAHSQPALVPVVLPGRAAVLLEHGLHPPVVHHQVSMLAVQHKPLRQQDRCCLFQQTAASTEAVCAQAEQQERDVAPLLGSRGDVTAQ